MGAIGYGWPFSDKRLGLVTPIEDMVKIFDWRDKIPSFSPAPKISTSPGTESRRVGLLATSNERSTWISEKTFSGVPLEGGVVMDNGGRQCVAAARRFESRDYRSSAAPALLPFLLFRGIAFDFNPHRRGAEAQR